MVLGGMGLTKGGGGAGRLEEEVLDWCCCRVLLLWWTAERELYFGALAMVGSGGKERCVQYFF
jgi:hypothetical protein